MKPSSLKRLEGLERSHAAEPRVHFIWVEASTTEAEIADERNRLIAEGHASADDRFIPIGWK